MSKRWVEVQIRVTEASGEQASGDYEYETTAANTADVPMEVYDHLVKQVGESRTHLPDPDR